MSDRALRVPPEIEDVVNQIGEFIEYWGFKNVHGRIWAHLFLAGCPLDAGELIDRLGISKALVSMSISDLLEYEVIQQASSKSDRGTIRYQANPDLTNVISNVLRKRERRMLSRVAAAVKQLKNLPEPAKSNVITCNRDRAEVLADFVQCAENSLDAILQLSDTSFQCLSRFSPAKD